MFLPEAVETLGTEALALLRQSGKNEIQIIVPDLFWVELASVFWKAIRRGNFPEDSADAALESLKRCDFPTVPSLELLDDAFQIATAHGRTAYDCLYVALAIQTGAQLITADDWLANALPARFPIKWLGAIESARSYSGRFLRRYPEYVAMIHARSRQPAIGPR
jgi:predicted nucleic acid-binding protein